MTSQLDYNEGTTIEDVLELDTETICTICNAEFLEPEDLKIHVDQVHAKPESNSRQCHFCPAWYTDLEAYAFHIRDDHLNSLQSCRYCTKVFTDVDQYRNHERRHYSAKKNHKKCSQCPDLFDNVSDLERHEYEKHNNIVSGILLQDYYPILSSVLNIKAETFLQLPHDAAYNCGMCGFSNTDLSVYVKHLQTKKCRSLVCNSCSNIYKKKPCLQRHIASHEDYSKSKNFMKCPKCNNNIKVLFYPNHVKTCKPIKCVICDLIFKSMSDLSDHHSEKHPLSIEVTLCKFCSRQCVGAASLQKHISRVHKSNFHLYKYKCVQCDTAFKHPQKLFAHYFIKHKDLEPYTCKICNKTFRVRKRFTIHIKLDHKSVGFVEFDENYHVFFTDKKSDNPFTPTCVIRDEDYLGPDEKSQKQKITVRKLETLQNLELDDLNQTETEAYLTELETKSKKLSVKRKKKFKVNHNNAKKIKKDDPEVLSLDSSDDEDDKPLVNLRKRSQQTSTKKRFPLNFKKTARLSKNNRKRLTCNLCQKYCYTYQNYQHHMSLHTRSVKTCIKCSKDFTSKEKLNKHLKAEHSSSKLTETLKSLLEKRKKGITSAGQGNTVSEMFQNTIKKASTDYNSVVATLTVVESGLSVQKFIENFTPESTEASKNNDNLNLNIDNTVSIKMVDSPFNRKPTIKFTKFEPKPMITNRKVSLPVKFTPDKGEKVKINIRLVQASEKSDFLLSYDNTEYNEENAYPNDYEEEDGIDDKGDTIPEVGHEVMLEESEEPPKSFPVVHKILLPNVPKVSDVSIAHLVPEAPYYKIVKVNDVINETNKREEKETGVTKSDMINLPDGTKLVTVNPLAHLLGDKDVDSIMEGLKNKYYKPKHKNVESLLTKALEKASTPTQRMRRKKYL